MEESRAEAKASLIQIREEARNEAREEKQAALAELHHKVQKELKYVYCNRCAHNLREAYSPANRLAREEKLKALESKKEKLEKERQERLKQKREQEREKLQQQQSLSGL